MSRLSLRQLQIVRAIMRTGSLTAASSELGISQPAASRLLRDVEGHLGVVLFERLANGLRPTHEAKALYPDIERLLSDVDYVERVADDLLRLKAGRLRIVAIPSLALTLVADAVGRFRRAHPSVSIQVEAALNFEVSETVRNRRADLGVAFDPLGADELFVEELTRTEIVTVMPGDHRLAGRKSLALVELAGEPLISFSRSLPIGDVIASAFQAAGATPTVVAEVGHSFLACALVRAGAGIALVDSLAQDSGLTEGLRFIPVEPAVSLTAVTLTADRRLSLAAAAFAETLREVAAVERLSRASSPGAPHSETSDGRRKGGGADGKPSEP